MKTPRTKSTKAERRAAIEKCRRRMATYTPEQRAKLDDMVNVFLGLKEPSESQG